MKFVNFHKVAIQNFLSIGTEPVEVTFDKGLHIVTGVNKDKQDRRNGVGKSTVADAIHFAVFGTTIRELKKENIVNHLIGKDTVVQLEFSTTENEHTTHYKVVRSLEPSRCKLYIDKEDKTRDTMSHTTDYICSILNTTQDIFQNCVIMTVNHTTPFMAKKKIEKRKFIEGIFNLEIFSNMLSALRTEYNDVKKDIEVEQAKHTEAEKSLDQYKLDKDQYISDKRDKIDKLKDRKKGNDAQLDTLRVETFDTDGTELVEIKQSISTMEANLETCDNKINKLNRDISGIDTTVTHKSDTLSKIGTSDDKCPVCLKSMSEHDRQHIKSEKTKILDEISNCKSARKDKGDMLEKAAQLRGKLKKVISSQNTLLNEHNIKISESKNNKQKIEQFEEWNKQIDTDIENLRIENNQFDETINRQQLRLDEIHSKIISIQHKLGILDVVKFIVSEEGVKSYIVRKILQVFNSKLSYYLSKMDANCLCIFNEYFEEEIVDEKGKVCSYYNFSGAERKSIDLACLFAFMDIRRLQGCVAYNFSIYDELLDSSLDEKGVDLVLELLRERVDKYKECVMIISHRKESIKIGTHYKNPGEVIFLEKLNGITRRVEFKEDTT